MHGSKMIMDSIKCHTYQWWKLVRQLEMVRGSPPHTSVPEMLWLVQSFPDPRQVRGEHELGPSVA